MDYRADADKLKKHFNSMVEAGAELIDKAGAYNPLLAVFQDGADLWVADNGTQSAKSYVTYEGVFYYVPTAIQRFDHYKPTEATNNYWPIPKPIAGVFPYLMGMMVIKDMVVQDPNGKKYKCILPSGEYKLVNPPSQASSIFKLEE